MIELTSIYVDKMRNLFLYKNASGWSFIKIILYMLFDIGIKNIIGDSICDVGVIQLVKSIQYTCTASLKTMSSVFYLKKIR